MPFDVNLADGLAEAAPRTDAGHAALPALALFGYAAQHGHVEVEDLLIDFLGQHAGAVGDQPVAQIAFPVLERILVHQGDDRRHRARVIHVQVFETADAGRREIRLPVEAGILGDELVPWHGVVGQIAVAALGPRPHVLGDRGLQREDGFGLRG